MNNQRVNIDFYDILFFFIFTKILVCLQVILQLLFKYIKLWLKAFDVKNSEHLRNVEMLTGYGIKKWFQI